MLNIKHKQSSVRENKIKTKQIYLSITWKGGEVKEKWLAQWHTLERTVKVVALVELHLGMNRKVYYQFQNKQMYFSSLSSNILTKRVGRCSDKVTILPLRSNWLICLKAMMLTPSMSLLPTYNIMNLKYLYLNVWNVKSKKKKKKKV